MRQMTLLERMLESVYVWISGVLSDEFLRHCIGEAGERAFNKTGKPILDLTFEDLWDALTK